MGKPIDEYPDLIEHEIQWHSGGQWFKGTRGTGTPTRKDLVAYLARKQREHELNSFAKAENRPDKVRLVRILTFYEEPISW